MKKLLAVALVLLSAAHSAFAGNYIGDYQPGDTVDCNFGTTNPSTGASFTLGGTPAVSVYKDNSTTESTTGVTLTADFDTRTGLNHVRITTGSDGTFYAAGSFFEVVITTGTVNSVSVVGQPVCSFSLAKVSALRPATAGRTLTVSSGGAADANVTQYGGTNGTFSSGRPEVNTTHLAGSSLGTCTGAYPTLGIVDCGTAQAATGTTLQLRSAASFADSELIGATCVITGGTTGVGQARAITAYTGSTDTATVATWTTTPTGTITYACFGTAAGGSAPSAGTVAAAVWDEALSGHTTSGTSGERLGRIPNVAAGASGGLFIAGTNAATTITTALTTTFTGNVTGSVGSVTGAVGSVASGGITAASFAAGAIDANAIATDAIGSAELAASAATEIGNATWAITITEPTGKPTWTSSTMKQMLEWQAAFSINKITQTSTTKTLRNTGDSANISTCAVSDNGTTFTQSACTP